MPSTPRRGIVYPNPDRTEAPDVAIHIGNVALAADASAIYAHGTKAGRPPAAIEGKFYLANDTTPHQLSYDEGAQWLDLGAAPQFGTRALRPVVSAVGLGAFYYATDQATLYLSDGTNWQRIGDQAGSVIWTIETAARTGYIICTGQAWPGTTGIYADLFAKWGGLYPTALPDMQGRQFVAKGTHSDINTVGFNEGAIAPNRRPKHKHPFVGSSVNTGNDTPAHTHDGNLFYVGGAGAVGGIPTSTGGNIGTLTTGPPNVNHVHPVTAAGTVGPQTGAEPTDSSAYITLQPQVKL